MQSDRSPLPHYGVAASAASAVMNPAPSASHAGAHWLGPEATGNWPMEHIEQGQRHIDAYAARFGVGVVMAFDVAAEPALNLARWVGSGATDPDYRDAVGLLDARGAVPRQLPELARNR
jgi:hypothetical protein